jgi:hypothetical protein
MYGVDAAHRLVVRVVLGVGAGVDGLRGVLDPVAQTPPGEPQPLDVSASGIAAMLYSGENDWWLGDERRLDVSASEMQRY